MTRINKIITIVFAFLMLLPFAVLPAEDAFAAAAPVTVTPSPAAAATENNPLIQSFSVRETGNGIYRAEWDIANVTDTVYIRIYASQDKSSFEGILAQEIESGTHGAVDVYMPDIDSGYYSFYISAAGTSGMAGYKYSDNYFFYDNQNRQEKLTGVTMCVEKNDLFLLWEGGSYASVLLYDPESGELISQSDGHTSPCTVSLPKGKKSFLIGAASYDGGIVGRFDPVDSKTLIASKAELLMPEDEVTVNKEAAISVKSDLAYSLKIFRNRVQTEPVSSASDTYTIELEKGENDIIVFLTDADGKLRASEAMIESDTIAPELVLTGQTNDVRTVEEEITLKGHVDEDATLKYLGEEVELAGGNFYLRKPLGFGRNQFTLTASDRAGNSTEKTITVERVFWSQKNILIILLAISVVAVTVIELILLFYRSDRKRKSAAPEDKTKKGRAAHLKAAHTVPAAERTKEPIPEQSGKPIPEQSGKPAAEQSGERTAEHFRRQMTADPDDDLDLDFLDERGEDR